MGSSPESLQINSPQEIDFSFALTPDAYIRLLNLTKPSRREAFLKGYQRRRVSMQRQRQESNTQELKKLDLLAAQQGIPD